MTSAGAPFLLLAWALLGSAAAQARAEPAGSHLRSGDYRVASVSYRLAVGASSACPRRIPQAGLALHHLAQYAPRNRASVAGTFALDRGPGILAVAPGSPAAAAGLRAGDVLLAVNGDIFESPAAIAAERRADRRRQLMAQADDRLDRALGTGPARLAILREGAEASVALSAEPGCPIRARLANAEESNAFSDGENVVVTAPLLAALENDDELAVVLAHELAHNVLGHADALRGGRISRRQLRALGLSSTRDLEMAADRLAVRLMGEAGFNPRAGLPLWQRLQRSARGLRLFASHPGARQRALRWAEALEAMEASRR